LQAGRNITFNANVTTDNGNLTAIAGDPGADQNNRDLGTPTLTIEGILPWMWVWHCNVGGCKW
ncbi:MAG: hypothetical protein IPO71_10505, partial [Nitrosomonas sp.]|nr:hypothetical protein [Nitrosomonas sp.]